MSSSREKMPLPSLGGTLGFGDCTGNPPFCVACNKSFATQGLYDAHLPGFTHKSAIAKMGKGQLFGCEELYSHIEKLLEPVQKRDTS